MAKKRRPSKGYKKKHRAPQRITLAPHLAGLPLAVCVLALLVVAAGLAVNVVEMNVGKFLFVADMFSIYRPFLDVAHFDFPLTGWRVPVAPFYFPDYILFFALAFVLPLVWALPATMLALHITSAVGWTFVCRDMGGSVKTQIAIWFVHALQILLLSYPLGELMIPLILPLNHAGAWVALPWLLWAVLDARRRWFLFGLLALIAASDLVIVTWFVVPALFTMAVAIYFKHYTFRQLGHWALVFVTAVAIGKMIADNLPFTRSMNATEFITPNLSKLWESMLSVLQYNIGFLASEYILFACVWLVFVGLLTLVVIKHYPHEKALPFQHFFFIVFVPAAMACPLAAQIVVGIGENFQAGKIDDPHLDIALRMRYIYPFIFLPLFVGWVFLPFYFQRLSALKWRVSDKHFSLALCAVLCVLALPRIANVFDDDKVISPFNTPFSVCVKQAANRLGWTGAIGVYRFWNRAVIDPSNPIRQNVVVEALPRIEQYKDIPLFINWDFTNRHWNSGEFQVVAIDNYKGNNFLAPPRTTADACATDGCRHLNTLRSISEESARAVWGAPAEVVECEGVGLYHYDPPIRYDHSQRTTAKDYPILLHRQQ